MPYINPHFKKLNREYIFPIIEEKLAALQSASSPVEIVNFGIGDTALPLAQAVAQAIALSTEEMAKGEEIRGYGPSQGYAFLREAIALNEFAHLGISAEEIFISDGANSDTVNILDLFSLSNVVAITNPTYPAYLDSALLHGKQNIIFLPCLEENQFSPVPPKEHCDLVYLCSPNNPTGVGMTRVDLKKWVDYALAEKAILLIDSAYEAFVTSPDVPRSIFEIPGAKECAIEFRSFSKTAGFTGLRCAYTILPKSVKADLARGKGFPSCFWSKRQSIKFNGVCYPVQRGAEAVYSAEGQKQTRAQIALYQEQAKRLKEGLMGLGHTCAGGIDSPYIWWKTPRGLSSWEFFDLLLHECHLISIPGSGFGSCGEGYVRLSAFCKPETAALGLERLRRI